MYVWLIYYNFLLIFVYCVFVVHPVTCLLHRHQLLFHLYKWTRRIQMSWMNIMYIGKVSLLRPNWYITCMWLWVKPDIFFFLFLLCQTVKFLNTSKTLAPLKLLDGIGFKLGAYRTLHVLLQYPVHILFTCPLSRKNVKNYHPYPSSQQFMSEKKGTNCDNWFDITKSNSNRIISFQNIEVFSQSF